MANAMRIGSTFTALGLIGMLAACASPGQQHASRASVFGDKVDSSNIGLATKAQAYLEKGDAANAVDYAERAVANTSNDAGFRALLGNAYFAAGRFTSAEAAYRDSLTLLPTQSQVALKLVLVTIAQGKTGEAMSLLDQARAMLDPADYGLALALAGDPNSAVAALDAAARQEGADGRVRQNLALAHALAGDWTAAREIAAQDVPADQLDARIQQWASFAKPSRASDQVASMLGVTPAAVDPGQPVRLALNASKDAPRYAENGAVPAVTNLAPAAPVAQAEAPVDAPVEEAAPIAVAEAPAPVDVAPIAAAPAPVAVAAAMPIYVPAVEAVAENATPVDVAPVDTAPVDADPVNADPVEAAPAVAPKAKPAFRRAAVALGPVAVGRSVVQLGAFSSRANVAAAWNRFAAKYPSLEGRSPTTAKVTVNGRTVYRLSVSGFEGSREANGFCSSIKASGGNCFVRASDRDSRVRVASL